ncbi:UDP-4-amino-4,6-dideoxy-N-acetyl-beta-L-altrosamine transaminase [Candidatus Beckwithbacteria bacterium]|nr:UDP-4-amino-4,6-dideoxy-N-acetyl-beta-L-altrosamine transaminase [Candidatus Beckwithbacteria bacterium]
MIYLDHMSQNKFSYGRQSISQKDITAVTKVLQSNFLTQGPSIKEFEEKFASYCETRYAVAVCNGTAALHLAVLALELDSSSEAITSPMSFAASANCVLYARAKINFADIDPYTGLIDPAELAKKVTPKTKLLIPVHYAGQACNMAAIAKLAKKYKLYIIEDAAHAIGSSYKNRKIGSCQYSDMTTFSFHPVKTITSGEGGMITTNNKKLYEKLLMLRTHGITKQNFVSKPDGNWYYEMQALGYNYRLTDIQATLGLSQLSQIEKFKKKRSKLVNFYDKAFANDPCFKVLGKAANSDTCYHLYPLLFQFDKLKITKQQLFKALQKKGLFLQVHYIPIHLQPYYQNLGFKKGDFPNAEQFYQQELSLPLYVDLTIPQAKQVVKIIKELAQ